MENELCAQFKRVFKALSQNERDRNPELFDETRRIKRLLSLLCFLEKQQIDAHAAARVA